MPRQDLQTVEDFDLEMQQRNYIGSRILPTFGVQARTARFQRVRLKSLLAASDEKLERAAKTGYSRSDWDFEQDSFITQNRGVEEEIDDDEKALYATMFDAELMATQRAYERLFNNFDRLAIQNTVDIAENAGQTTAAGVVWSNKSAALPRDNVKAAKFAMWQRTGMMPNTLVISEWRFEDLKDNDQMIDRMAGQGSGESSKPNEITEAALAEILGVDQVLVAKAIEYDGTVSSIFPEDKGLLLRAPRTSSLREPCFGRTFVFAGIHGDFLPSPFTYRQEEIECDIVRLKHEYEQKVMYTEMAEVITGIA